jgi:hypothetical protein
MADISLKAVDSANKHRAKVGEFLKAYKELLSMDKEYIAIDVAGNLPADAFDDITNLEFTDGIGAVQTVMAAIEANKTNIYKVSDGGQR